MSALTFWLYVLDLKIMYIATKKIFTVGVRYCTHNIIKNVMKMQFIV